MRSSSAGECTCVSTAYSSSCTDNFACIDPSAPCVDDDSITSDFVQAGCIPSYIQDGYCDVDNNKAACDYDGGDVSISFVMSCMLSCTSFHLRSRSSRRLVQQRLQTLPSRAAKPQRCQQLLHRE